MDVLQQLCVLQIGVFRAVLAQKDELPVRMGGGSREHRIQVQPVVYCAQIPEHGPAGADGLKIRRDGQALLLHGGVQPRISAPGDLGDVVVAQGQPLL